MEPSLNRYQHLDPTSLDAPYRAPSEPRRPARVSSDLRIAHQLIDASYPDFLECDREPVRDRILMHIDFLRASYPDIHDVYGKRILDLACGSTCYEDNPRGKYDPWMSRLLCHLGAQPVGVDIAPQRGESFESHIVDLTIPGSLRFLESSSFDGVYVAAFPTRKAIRHIVEKGLDWTTIRGDILRHLARCLKPDGKMIRQFSIADEQLVSETLATIFRPPPPSLFFDDDF